MRTSVNASENSQGFTTVNDNCELQKACTVLIDKDHEIAISTIGHEEYSKKCLKKAIEWLNKKA